MGKIVSTHSYRGGTGKSNVTANIAVQLAMAGKRVGICDTDIQSPGIHVLFRMDPERLAPTLNDFLWGRCSAPEAAHDVTASVTDAAGRQALPGGASVHLVPSSIKTGEIARIIKEGYDVAMLNDGFRAVIDELALDYFLIDTHPGLNEETLLSIAISDVLLLILRPDQQDYQGTAVTLEVARRLEVPDLLLVVNKALQEFDFPDLEQRISATYRAPVAGVLPLTEDMVRLGSSGLFSVIHPDHAFSRTIRDIARRIA